MKRIGKVMFQGLVALLPAILTVYILFWLVRTAETMLGALFKALLPEGSYVPGMGIVGGLAIILLVGLTLNAILVRKLLGISEALMNRIPLVKILYGPLKDFVGFFAAKRDSRFDQVVTIDLAVGGKPVRMLGLVTRSDFSDLPPGIGGEGEIAVYIPMSYQIGGFTIIVPRSSVNKVEISTHRAMGFVLTGGMTADSGAGQAGNGESSL